MRPLYPLVLAILPLAAIGPVACGGDDAGTERRTVQIVQRDDACAPDRIELTVRERISFRVVNESKDDQEVEGEDGIKLEELLVPAGKTRVINYTAPDKAGSGTIKCYRPGGQTTMITVVTAE